MMRLYIRTILRVAMVSYSADRRIFLENINISESDEFMPHSWQTGGFLRQIYAHCSINSPFTFRIYVDEG